MAKKALAIVTKETQKLETGEEDRRIWRERALSEEELLHGTDEAGRTGWFLRLTLPGLYPRRIGPYPSHEAASAVHKVYAHLSIEPVRQALDQQAERDAWQSYSGSSSCFRDGIGRAGAGVAGVSQEGCGLGR